MKGVAGVGTRGLSTCNRVKSTQDFDSVEYLEVVLQKAHVSQLLHRKITNVQHGQMWAEGGIQALVCD